MNEINELDNSQNNERVDWSIAYVADESEDITVDTITEIRHTFGLTQQQFADKYHIPVSTLAQWEQHKRIPSPYVVQMIRDLWQSEQTIEDLRKRYMPMTVGQLLEFTFDKFQEKVGETFKDLDDDANVITHKITDEYDFPIHIEGVGCGLYTDECFKPYMNSEVKHYETVYEPWGEMLKIQLAETPVKPKKIMDEATMKRYIEDIDRFELYMAVKRGDGTYLKAVCVALTSLGYDADWVNDVLWKAMYDRYFGENDNDVVVASGCHNDICNEPSKKQIGHGSKSGCDIHKHVNVYTCNKYEKEECRGNYDRK